MPVLPRERDAQRRWGSHDAEYGVVRLLPLMQPQLGEAPHQLMLGYTGALRTDFTEDGLESRRAGLGRDAAAPSASPHYQTGTINDRSGSSPYFS